MFEYPIRQPLDLPTEKDSGIEFIAGSGMEQLTDHCPDWTSLKNIDLNAVGINTPTDGLPCCRDSGFLI